jgi:hypothetical protein
MKVNNTRNTYSAADRTRICDLTNEGVSDTKIVELTGFGCGFVASVTTKYWKDKMIKTDEKDNE